MTQTGKLIFVRIPLATRPKNWLMRLTSVGVVAGPSAGGITTGVPEGIFEFWIADLVERPPLSQVTRAIGALRLPNMTHFEWDDPKLPVKKEPPA